MTAAARATSQRSVHGNLLKHTDSAFLGQPPPPLQIGPHEKLSVCVLKPWTNASCGQSRFNGSDTSSFYAMPRGMRYWHDVASSLGRPLNAELGRDYARLPVTHTHTVQHAWQSGLWFFYTRGCSDYEWNVGRTLLVRNRCHMAAVLDRLRHDLRQKIEALDIDQTCFSLENSSHEVREGSMVTWPR